MSKLFYVKGTGIMAPAGAFVLSMTARMVTSSSAVLQNGHVMLQPKAVIQMRPLLRMLGSEDEYRLSSHELNADLQAVPLVGSQFMTDLEESDGEQYTKVLALEKKVRIRARKLAGAQRALDKRRHEALGNSNDADLASALREVESGAANLQARTNSAVARINRILEEQETWFSSDEPDSDDDPNGYMPLLELRRLLIDDHWHDHINLMQLDNIVLEVLSGTLVEVGAEAESADDDYDEDEDDPYDVEEDGPDEPEDHDLSDTDEDETQTVELETFKPIATATGTGGVNFANTEPEFHRPL